LVVWCFEFGDWSFFEGIGSWNFDGANLIHGSNFQAPSSKLQAQKAIRATVGKAPLRARMRWGGGRGLGGERGGTADASQRRRYAERERERACDRDGHATGGVGFVGEGALMA